MRILTALVLTLLAACGGSSPKSEPDLAVKAADLSVSGGKLGCFALVECVQKCNGAATCEQTCATEGTMNGTKLFGALFACAYGVCTKAGDSGTAACASATDLTPACQSCVATAAQSATCSSELGACEADTAGL